MIDDPPCDAVEVRLGLCGADAACIDNVELVKLLRP